MLVFFLMLLAAMYTQQIIVIFSFIICAFSDDVPIINQFQASAIDGQYKYGYETGVDSKIEERTADGRTIGSYSYIGKDGKIQKYTYTAGVEGFKVVSLDDPVTKSEYDATLHILPKLHKKPTPVDYHHRTFSDTFSKPVLDPQGNVVDTPEVAAAKAQHAAAHAEVRKFLPVVPESSAHSISHQHFATKLHHSAQKPLAISVLDSDRHLVDTPEVLAAKLQHAAAHAQIRKILPILHQEDKISFSPIHQTSSLDSFPRMSIAKLSEEVPRNELGETPEIAAAREAHFAFYKKVKSQIENANPHF